MCSLIEYQKIKSKKSINRYQVWPFRKGLNPLSIAPNFEAYILEELTHSTANVFKKGHRIRVDISSSNFPRWDVNSNTGEPLGQHRRMIKANNTIYHSLERPSQIVLPIVPIKS